jgi:hypothetical protein
MSAEIKTYHGTPTLFLDGKPVFDGMMIDGYPVPEGFPAAKCTEYFRDAGVHLYAYDFGTGIDWCGPRPGRKGVYNFDNMEYRFRHLMEIDPQAHFHLRLQLEMPEWWQKLHPEECELASDGRRLCQSFASKLWREEAKDYLREFITCIKNLGLGDRIIAYQTGAGHTGEWVKGGSSMNLPCGDYSQPMREHFRVWLREKYHDDEKAMRTAWAKPYVTFDTAEVPPAVEQFNTTQFTFRNPKKEQSVIDYYICLADLCGDLVVDFCTTVKETAGRQSMAGVFFGYLMELAWNAGFFSEGVDSTYSTYQRSGHLGFWKALESPNVDFFVSPYSYGFRGIGGDGPAMLPTESLRIHNKLYIFEEDSRTHLQMTTEFGKANTLEETITLLQRNMAYIATHGHGVWWGTGIPAYPAIELSQQPAFRPMIKNFQDIGTLALELDRTPSAEIAVLVDDESIYYEWLRNDLDLPLIFQQRLWGLPHMGAPHDTYLLNDFIEGKIKPYKLYIFLNPFHLNKERREKLKKELRKDGRVALWIYAAGYLDEDGNLGNMSDLTGFGHAQGDHPWGPLINLIDFNHPITAGLKEDMFWGTNAMLGPVFHIEDGGARILGNVVYSQGRCRGGFGVKEFPEWKSIYSAAPNLPAWILRGIARYAGVHIYSDAGETLYATKELLGVHTAGGGERDFNLPEKVEQVYELFSQKEVARNTDHFQVTLEPVSTVLYYTGKAIF